MKRNLWPRRASRGETAKTDEGICLRNSRAAGWPHCNSDGVWSWTIFPDLHRRGVLLRMAQRSDAHTLTVVGSTQNLNGAHDALTAKSAASAMMTPRMCANV